VNNRLGLAIFLGVAGCAGGTPDGQPQTEAPVTESLQYNDSDNAITGVFKHADDVLKFSSLQNDPGVFETTIVFNGLTLDSVADISKGLITLDGYTTATGAETTLADDDTAMISAFRKALDAQVPVREGATNVVEVLRGQVGHWEEWPHTLSLTATTVIQQDRSITYLCSYIGAVWTSKHDCNVCSGYNGQTNCEVYSYIGDYGESATYYLHGSSWTTAAYNHAVLPYEYGDCFGRCGSDCGSGHVYSVDCANHDSCVRNGHSLASLYCDDEFAACADDVFGSNCY
jgi:hypothetical protein